MVKYLSHVMYVVGHFAIDTSSVRVRDRNGRGAYICLNTFGFRLAQSRLAPHYNNNFIRSQDIPAANIDGYLQNNG